MPRCTGRRARAARAQRRLRSEALRVVCVVWPLLRAAARLGLVPAVLATASWGWHGRAGPPFLASATHQGEALCACWRAVRGWSGRAPADAAGRLGCPAGRVLTCACLARQEDDGEAGKDDIGNEVVERDATGRWSRVCPGQRAAVLQGRCLYLCGSAKRCSHCKAPAR